MTDEKLVLKAHTCDDEIVKRIQTILTGSNQVLTEIHMTINTGGISVRQLDTSKALMVIWELPSSMFNFYEYDHDEKEVVICLEAKALHRAVLTAKDRLEFQLDRVHSSGKFTVTGQSDFKHVERLGLLTPGKPIKKPNLLPGDVRFSIQGKVFRKILQAANKVGSGSLRVAALNSTVLFEIQSDSDTYTAEVSEDVYDCVLKIERFTKMADCMYAINYMFELRRFVQNRDTVYVEFTKNKPITIKIDEDDTSVTLILAPRIERRMNDD